jgi:hypothetical protein
MDSFTVPAGWTQANFDLLGAQGGGGGSPTFGLYYGGYPGLGGQADATIPVTPGETFEINVGAAGAASQFYGGSGGGASDIRTGSCAATLSCGLAGRALVAGGGGGAGGSSVTAQPGNGGNGSGANGVSGTGSDPSTCQIGGGGGGTQSSGGAGGLAGAEGNAGAAGTLGSGGVGFDNSGYFGAGNGGDGYYGGGGGGGRVDPSNAPQYSPCDGAGGGGGSGYITPSAVASYVGTGVGSGNGQVVITGYSGTTTTTSLVSSANPSQAGGQVTYTATVSPVPDGGTVMFTDAGVPVSGCSTQSVNESTGVATCTVTFPSIGSHSIEAHYSGDANFSVSSSSSLSQAVVAAASTSTALTSSANPSQASQQVTYTATVSPVPDGGTVAFSDGGGAISGCTAQSVDTSTGVATCSVTYPITGSHAIAALYSGDASFPASTSPTLTQVVNPTGTSLVLASSSNPSDLGQQVIYTATVSPVPDGGTVAFSDGASVITGCSAQSVDTSTGEATCAVTYVSPGSHPISAAFSGDASYGPSSAPTLTQTYRRHSLTRPRALICSRSHLA